MMERKKVLVAFADILGFGGWVRRASNAPEITRDLIEAVYDRFEEFSNSNAYHTKFLGDGIMAIRELSAGHNCGQTREFLKNTYMLTTEIHEIMQVFWPRPDGFRLRIASGHVWKKNIKEKFGRRRNRNAEYVGYCVNLAQRLLEVSPHEIAICHESIIEILGEKKKNFKFDRLEKPKEQPRGIDPEDIAGLWSFSPDLAKPVERIDRKDNKTP